MDNPFVNSLTRELIRTLTRKLSSTDIDLLMTVIQFNEVDLQRAFPSGPVQEAVKNMLLGRKP